MQVEHDYLEVQIGPSETSPVLHNVRQTNLGGVVTYVMSSAIWSI